MMKIEKQVISRGYDRVSCWVHARCGVIPKPHQQGALVVTLQKSLMGSENHVHDIFSGLYTMLSDDGGATWTQPVAQQGLARWCEPDGTEIAPCDFTPQWHSATGRLLGIGVTSQYLNNRSVSPMRRRESVYSVFDPETGTWGKAQLLQMPDPVAHSFCGAGCVQWEELPNGEILLPVYFADPQSLAWQPLFSVMVLRCRFDGVTLSVMEKGEPLALPVCRGLTEPSLTRCGGKYWLTLRNDLKAYGCTSDDGLHFTQPKPWVFCDGQELGSHNTQQHWVRLGERLFLVYTRRGLANDHIVRNRAPLLICEVDQKRQCLLRQSERVLIPNRGAQLGNFGAVQNGDEEAYVCVSEWMENAGPWNDEVWAALQERHPHADLDALGKTPGRCEVCELEGSDNSIYLIRLTQESEAALTKVREKSAPKLVAS